MKHIGIGGAMGLTVMALAACSGGSEAPAAGDAPAGFTVQVAGLTGDASAGQRAFGQCRTCHTIQAGVNRVGPSLHGVIGRAAGTAPDFLYSDAMKADGRVWDEAALFAFLEAPRTILPGTKMAFVGIRDPQQRADVVAYLKSQSAPGGA